MNSLIEWIDSRIESILKRPLMYGGFEAIEFQFLMLLEFRARVLELDPTMILKKWIRFCHSHSKDIGNSCISNVMDKNGEDVTELTKLMTEFYEQQKVNQ